VRSGAVGETYWPTPEPALDGGIFRTCDLAEIKNGEIFLRGRTDDHINVAGRKVSPTIIEQALREHEAVAECVVFGVPSGNADRIDLIVACVAADRPSTWISEDFIVSYSELHRRGIAHSVEVCEGEEVVGGLYGVAIGGFFGGEGFVRTRFATEPLFELFHARGEGDECVGERIFDIVRIGN